VANIPLILNGSGHAEHVSVDSAKSAIEYASTQSAINMYYKPGASADSGLWMPTPGMVTADTATGADTVRGMFYDTINTKLFVASGNDLTRWTGGTQTDDLTIDLSSTNGRVSFAANPRTDEILIVDGTAGYILNPSSNTLTVISDVDYPDNADICAYIDGYFLVARSGDTSNPGRFYWSNLNDGTSWTATDIATKEGGTDSLIDIIVHNRQIYLLGETSSEIWYNSGDLDKTFERYQGGHIEVGVTAKHMAAIVDNRVMFPSKTTRGTGPVVALSGAQMEVISNHFIASQIERRSWNGSASDANLYGFGYAFQESGHEFYAMSDVSVDVTEAKNPTLVYDASTKLWHERAHYSETNFPRSEIFTSAVFCPDTSIGTNKNQMVFGHRTAGELYEVDAGLNITNAGTGNNTHVVPRRIIGPMIRSDKRIRFSEVTLDIGSTGGAGTITASDIELYISKDGGNSWGSAITMNVDDGTYDGDGYLYRAHNLGTGKNWRFRLDFNGDTTFTMRGLWGRPYGDSEPRATYG